MNTIQILDPRSFQLQNQKTAQRTTLGTKNKNTQQRNQKTHTTHHTHKTTLSPRAFSGVSTYRWWCLVSFGMISANRVGKGHGAGPLWGNDEPWHWGEWSFCRISAWKGMRYEDWYEISGNFLIGFSDFQGVWLNFEVYEIIHPKYSYKLEVLVNLILCSNIFPRFG